MMRFASPPPPAGAAFVISLLSHFASLLNTLRVDGVPDASDNCPVEDATGFDSDGDGCIDDSEGDGVPDNVDSNPLAFTAITGGNWFDSAIWEGGIVPSASDDKEILAGVTVIASGLVENSAEIANFGIILVDIEATLDNSGSIANPGVIFLDIQSSLDNSGNIESSGTIIISSGANTNNSGTINNSGTVSNSGNIFNDCGGVFSDLGTFTGNPVEDVCDTDGDGVLDVVDNCPLIANVNQLDLDADEIGFSCDDSVDITQNTTVEDLTLRNTQTLSISNNANLLVETSKTLSNLGEILVFDGGITVEGEIKNQNILFFTEDSVVHNNGVIFNNRNCK